MDRHALASVAVIPDGNRRFAHKANISLEEAYLAGFRKSEEAVRWGADSGVKSMTFWALSLDNFTKRSDNELSLLFRMMKGHAQNVLKSKTFKDYDVTVKFFGKRDIIPPELNKMFSQVEDKFQGSGDLRINFGIAYNGRDEILTAAKNLATDISAGKIRASAVGEHEFEKYLYLNEAPDLVIRTGNSPRLSGLMPWQTVYSELFFSPKLWPEFSKQDYAQAVEFYANVERKFGK